MQTYDLHKQEWSNIKGWETEMKTAKCTNATNRRSGVGLSTPFDTDLIFHDAV